MLEHRQGISAPAGGAQIMSENVSETKHQPQPEGRERGEGGLYLRGKTWWIRYSFRGKPRRESSGSSDPAVAQKRLDRRMKQVWADRQGLQTFIPKADKVLISELLDALTKEYQRNRRRSFRTFKSHLKPIRSVFGELRAINLTTKHVEDYQTRRLED